MHVGFFFCCFHNAPNSNMDLRIFNMRGAYGDLFACVYTQLGLSPVFIHHSLAGFSLIRGKEFCTESNLCLL